MKKSTKPPVSVIAALQNLLHQQAFETQEEICHTLRQQGFSITQVTVSRLLHKLGVTKVNEGGRSVYRLIHEQVPLTPNDSLKHLVLQINANETVIVIQTVPGSAQLVARLLDHMFGIELLGTVAGDDTILVIPTTIKKIQHLHDDIVKRLMT